LLLVNVRADTEKDKRLIKTKVSSFFIGWCYFDIETILHNLIKNIVIHLKL